MHSNRSTPVLRRAILPLLSIITASAIALAQTKVEPHWNLFSEEQDVEIGRQSAVEAEKKLRLVTDSQIVSYVDRMGKRLVAKSQGPDFPYTFKVVDDAALNAFALPGGPIYLNRGVLEAARNDGEVAGVLAHEIAHVALRHGTANVSKQQLTQAGFGLLGALIGQRVGKSTGQIISAAGGFGLNALFLKYSRTAESEADIYGAQMLARARYNPRDMIGFFETMEAHSRSSGSRTVEWLSSHPSPDHRMERIEEEAKLLRVRAGRTETNELAVIQAKLGRFPTPRNEGTTAKAAAPPAQTTSTTASARPAAGALTCTVGPIEAPSSSMREFTSANLPYRVSYPSNWTVYQSGRTGAAFAPGGGVMEKGEGKAKLLCGAIVNQYQPFGNDVERDGDEEPADVSIERAYGDVRSMVLQGNPHLSKVEGSGKRFRLPDGSRKGVTLRGTDPQTGVVERVSVIATETRNQGVVYMLFVVPENQAEKFDPALDAMVASLGGR